MEEEVDLFEEGSSEVGSSGKVSFVRQGRASASRCRGSCRRGRLGVLAIKAGSRSCHHGVCHQGVCHQRVRLSSVRSRRLPSRRVRDLAIKVGGWFLKQAMAINLASGPNSSRKGYKLSHGLSLSKPYKCSYYDAPLLALDAMPSNQTLSCLPNSTNTKPTNVIGPRKRAARVLDIPGRNVVKTIFATHGRYHKVIFVPACHSVLAFSGIPSAAKTSCD